MYVHDFGAAFNAALPRLCGQMRTLVAEGLHHDAAALFLDAARPVLAHTNDEAWEPCARYNLALALGQAGLYDEARRQMDASLLFAGGDDDGLIYPERQRRGDALNIWQEEAMKNGVRAVFITALPKSASAFVSTTLGALLESPILRVSASSDMRLGWILSRWAAQIARGGAVTHEHYPADNGNLEALAEAGVTRVSVQIRDPRAALWSYYHHAAIGRRLAGSGAPIEPFIDGWYADAVRWLDGWRAAADNKLGITVDFFTYEQVRSSPEDVLLRLLGEAGSSLMREDVKSYLAARAIAGDMPPNYRQADPEEWRSQMSPSIQQRLWDETPETVRIFLDMRKEPSSDKKTIVHPSSVVSEASSLEAPIQSYSTAATQADRSSISSEPMMGWSDDRPDVHIDWAFRGTSLVAFAGPGHALGSIGEPFSYLRSLHDLGADTVFMRDRNVAWYQRGVVGVGPSVASVLGYVRGLTNTSRRVITVGMSMGGFAAILFGAMAGVDEVFALAPQTFMDPENRVRYGVATFQNHINSPTWNASSPYLDLASVLRELPAFKTRIRIFYDDHVREDAAYANHLAFLPNVELVSYGGCGHAGVGARLKQHRVLEKFISEALTT